MEKDNYSEQLRRLQEEQEKAMRETDERINQWQGFYGLNFEIAVHHSGRAHFFIDLL